MAVGMGFEEAGIDEVLTVIQHLRVIAGKLFRFRRAADIGEYAVLDHGRLGKGSLFVHRDKIAENKRLFHELLLFFCENTKFFPSPLLCD